MTASLWGRSGNAVSRQQTAVLRPRPHAGARLYCFPWAGAGVGVFRTWPDRLPPSVEVAPVALAGHDGRLAEPANDSVASIADAVAPGLAADIDRPYFLFGHSLGAMIAYEVAARLVRYGMPPVGLLVSAARAPHVRKRGTVLHELSRRDFIAAVRGMQEAPNPVLHDDDLLDVILPTMRADFKAAETYFRQVCPALPAPIVAFHGSQDPDISSADVGEWAACTSEAFTLHSLPGGHLFVTSAESALLALVEAVVTALPSKP